LAAKTTALNIQWYMLRARQRGRKGEAAMDLHTLVGVLGLVAVALCWCLAVVLFRVGAPGTVARKLAWLLSIEGITLLTGGFIWLVLAGDQASDQWFEDNVPVAYEIASFIVHHLGDAGMIALYPAFLAAALRTRLTRPFGRRNLRITIAVVAVMMAAGTVVTMAGWSSYFGSAVLYATVMALFLFALVASIHAWWIAEPGIARTRARVFAIAFGIRDVCWGASYAIAFWGIQAGGYTEETPFFLTGKAVYALGTLLAVPLIAYGILKAKLFDIDLKIRWTLKQSTFAAAVLAITFAISEGAEMLVSAELGDMWGLVAAGVAVLFLKPLQAFAEKVVSLVMPNTQNTPEYQRSHKLRVYEEALAEALDEGGISPKERALLARLSESLEIPAAEADAIEAEVKMRIGNRQAAAA
jgi:hypothetical protein